VKPAFFSSAVLILLLTMSGLEAQGREVALKPPPGTEEETARLVFEYTNLERTRRGLAAFLPHPGLDRLSVYHGENMRDYNFFSHTDHNRRDPEGRRKLLFPGLLGGLGENIAYHYGATPEEAARNLVEGWMNSPPHRKNILAGGFTYLGVGIVYGEQIHGVQVFGDLTAEVKEGPAGPVPEGTAGVTLSLDYLGLRPREDLTVFLKVPDPSARFYISENRYYTGMGPLTPKWREGNRFTLTFDADKGRGTYEILFGYRGSFYPGGVSVVVE
jgi:uncharacterized protein YkwD